MCVCVCVCVCVYNIKRKQKNRKKGGWVHNQQRPEAGLVGKVEARRFPKDPRSEWREKEDKQAGPSKGPGRPTEGSN